MAEARNRADWARTSSLMALAANIVRDPRKGRPARPSDFDPYAVKAEPRRLRGRELEILRDVFCRDNRK